MMENYECYESLKEMKEHEENRLAKQLTVQEIIDVLNNENQFGTTKHEIALQATKLLNEAASDNANMFIRSLSDAEQEDIDDKHSRLNEMARELSEMLFNKYEE